MKRAPFVIAFALVATPLDAIAGDQTADETAAEPAPDTATKPASDADADAKAADPAAKKPPDPADHEADATEAKKPVEISGWLQPAFSVVYRGDAVPRDRWHYGAESTRAGVELSGTPISKWSYDLEVQLVGESNALVTDVNTVDTNGDGVPDDVATSTDLIPGLFVERAVIEYAMTPRITIVAGQHRVPFTVQEQTEPTKLMFLTRSGPDEIFIPGPDLGIQAIYRTSDQRVIGHLGGYNGTGEPVDATSVHGVVYLARVDVNPLGDFPLVEGANPKRSPFLLGFGLGLLFNPSRHYDAAGYPGADQRDVRASASFRMASGGFYLQAEVLRRQITDSLSDRPDITTGAYVQTSYYTPGAVGIAPVGRFGWATQDQGFAPRTTLWFEGGVAIYPEVSNPEALRILILYRGDRRVTEAEQANGAVVQAQIVW